jgi:hypothetical protein
MNKATARPDHSKALNKAIEEFAAAWIKAAQEDLKEDQDINVNLKNKTK